MYRGFDLRLNKNIFSPKEINEYTEVGKKNTIENERFLSEYFNELEKLNGNEIMKEWFPIITKKFDIFLSHSHKDIELALIIAGILKKRHNLEVFVDYIVWGNYINLLKSIDDNFCKSNDKKNGIYDYNSNVYYDYDMRNYSTSHINLMLMNSLNIMIDKCEALFFLNTPNSISKETIKQKTNSPWIFSEIQVSKMIRKKTPNRLVRETKLFSANEGLVSLNESNRTLQIEYEMNLNHLHKILPNDFEEWVYQQYTTSDEALDSLYAKYNLNNIFIDFSSLNYPKKSEFYRLNTK